MHRLPGLRVCFIAGTLGGGGAERQLYYMLKALLEQGVETRVLSLTRGEVWEARIRELGVPVIWVGHRRSRMLRLVRIMRELRAWRPHVVQSQHFYTNMYAAFAARMLRLDEIGALRSDAIHEVNAGWRALGLLNLRLPRIVAANSRRGIENAVTLGRRRDSLFFLPNVIDTAQFSGGERSLRGDVRLLSVGRLVPAKRIDRFIRLVARLRLELGHRVTGTIVGDGPLYDELASLARGLGMDDTVIRFAGAASDVAPHYLEASALVLTSDWEGTPNVVLEAMACGLPVVATRVGGIGDLLVDGTSGFIVDPADEDALLDRVGRLVGDPALITEVGRKALEHVLHAHSLSMAASALARLYAQLLGPRFPARDGTAVAVAR